MDELNIGVTVDASGASDALTKISTSIDKVDASTQRMTVSNADAARMIASTEVQSRKFLAALQEEVNTYNKGRAALLEYRAAQLGVTQQAQSMIDQLKRVDGAGIRDAGKGMEEMGFKTAGAKREILVLAHELSQGNFSRAAGSMMVLGERTGAASLLFSAAGVSALALGAGVAAVAYEAYQGYESFKKLEDSLKSTGNFVDMTTTQLSDMASHIVTSTADINTAKEALTGLAGTGRITGAQLAAFGSVAVNMAKDSGQSIDEVLKSLAGMADGALKWAEEYNKQHHFMSAAQVDLATSLDKEGKQAQVTEVVLKALQDAHTRMYESAQPEIGAIQTWWKEWGVVIDKTKTALMSIGAPKLDSDKINEKLKEREQLEIALRNATADRQVEGVRWANQRLEQNKAEINALREKMSVAVEASRVNAGVATSGASEFKANHYLEGGTHSKAEQKALDIAAENKQYAEAIADLQKNTATYEAVVKHHYDNLKNIEENARDKRGAHKMESAYDSSFESLGAEGVRLDDEIAQFKAYGKEVDKSRLAVLNFEIAKGKLNGQSAASIKTLRDMASYDDSQDQVLAEMKNTKAIEDKIAALKAETKAQDAGKEATWESMQMKDLDAEKTRISIEKYNQLKDAIHAAALEREQSNANRAIEAMDRDTTDKIEKIRQEAELTGKSALEHQKLAAALEIQAKAEKAIRDSPKQEVVIRAAAKSDTESMNAAIEGSATNMKSWDYGAKSAVKDYLDSVKDVASQSKKLYGDALNGMEDQLVNFLEHGKMSFKSLFTSIENDLAHMTAKKIMGTILGDGKSTGLTGLFPELFGGGSGGGGSLVSGAAGLADTMGVADFGSSSAAFGSFLMGGAFADGGDPPVGVPSLVGEIGPELFVPKVPGTIIPNGKFGGNAGPNINHSTVINIDSRTDQAQIYQLVSKSVAQGNADLVDHLQRSGKI